MNLVKSGFRLTRSELSALLRIIGADIPIGTDVMPLPQSDDVLKSLIDVGFLMPTGDTVIVDRAILVILKIIDAPKSYKTERNNGLVANCYQGETIDVILESVNPNIFLLTPLLGHDETESQYAEACENMQRRSLMYAEHHR